MGVDEAYGRAWSPGFPVVALIAGSNGAAQVLRLFEALPDQAGTAFLLMIGDDAPPGFAERLQIVSGLPVLTADAPLPIAPGQIRLAPPRVELTSRDGELRFDPVMSTSPAGTDDFLASLAEACADRPFAVVLCEPDIDLGQASMTVKRHGGCLLALTPEVREDVPSRRRLDEVDAILPAPELAQRLAGLAAPAIVQAEGDALLEIIVLVRTRTGHDFRHYKRATLRRLLERRMQLNQCDSVSAYRDHLALNPEETPPLLEDLLTGFAAPLARQGEPATSAEALLQGNQELRERLEYSSRQNTDLRKLIASAGIASILVDRRMRVRAFTPRATGVFALISSDVGRSLLDIAHCLEYPQLAEDAAEAFESLRSREREVPAEDGSWYIARVQPDIAEDGQVEGAVLTFIDITKRRQVEERLRQGEERMRLAAECTQDYIIFALDTDGRIVSWNHCAEATFGYGEAEVLGRSADLLYVEEDRQAGALQQELDEARQAGRAEDERWYRRKDGSQFFYSGATTALRDGGLHGFAKIGRDITAKKRLEAEQESRLEQSQVTAKLKDEFFAMVSHELKHPLNLIQLNAELIARLSVVKSQAIAARAVDTILGSVRSQARIIDDLLDLSRINTGKLKLNREPVSLPQLLGDIVDVIQAEATAKDIAIEMQLPQAGTLLVADADPIRVEQILWNLINNSLKFTPDGGTLYLRLAHEGDSLRIDVRDTGQGIPAEFLPKVFDLFGQVPEQRLSSTRHGLGIGLALVRELVEAHHGRIEASSPGIGQGSTFSVWLPEYIHSENDDVTDSHIQGQFDGLRVLMVDDSPDICEIMQTLLEMEGAEVEVANDGEMALKMAETEGYDLILSDIGMPKMDGLELIGRLRQLPHHARTAAIALTGYGGENDVNQALEAGFDAHIDKPVSLDMLLQAVANLCGTRPRR